MVKLCPVKEKTANKTQDYIFSTYNTDYISTTASIIRKSIEWATIWYQMFMIWPKYDEVISSERQNRK